MEYLVHLILFSIYIKLACGVCHTEYGPSGTTECLLLDGYNKYQWATCLTDKYIRTFSKETHGCKDLTRTYCWYQCMLELNGKGEGPVYDNCTCGRDAPKYETSKPTVTTSVIPNWCLSPSGSNCRWYKDCLMKRYQCDEDRNSFALDYAEKFCNLYDKHNSDFSKIGKQWIDAVRKCSQVKLVPFLRPFVQATCDAIEKTTLVTLPDCFIYPDQDNPSICSIGVATWARVFWTLKGTLNEDATTTLKQMLDIVVACGLDVMSTGMGKIQMDFRLEDESVLKNLNEFAENIAYETARKTGWDGRGVIHFGFPTSLNPTIIYVNILIAQKSLFDLNADVDSPDINVTAEEQRLAEAIKNGDVRLSIPGRVKFTNLSLCIDYKCTNAYLRVTPAPPKKEDGSGVKAKTMIIIVCLATFGIVLIVTGVLLLQKFRNG